jgi:ATP-dependent DNA ligase
VAARTAEGLTARGGPRYSLRTHCLHGHLRSDNEVCRKTNGNDEAIFLYAFDLIELNGDDLRRDPIEGRKATLEMILAKAGAGIRFNEQPR